MRVLQAVHALPPDTYGGSELYTAELAAELDARGHEVAIASPTGGSTVDVPVFSLPEPPEPDVQLDDGLPTRPLRPAVEERFEAVLAEFDPDVVHLQHLKGLSTTLPDVCADRDAACLLTLHDFWGLCHREQLYRPDETRCSGPESVEKCTDCYLDAVRGDPDGVPPAVYEQYEADVEQRAAHVGAALEATDLLVSPSRFLRETFVAFGTPPDDVVHQRNGIRVDRFEDTGFDGPPVNVGYAGRIAPEKGVHLLVEAFDRVGGDATLELFGRFVPEEDDYHARLADSAGDRVTFHGWYDDPGAPYRALDVFVLPSVWYENSPLVIQEAFAAGLPVVTADVGGMAELVTDGVDGLTFAVEDVDALADCLDSLVEDPATLETLRRGVEAPTRLDDHAAEIAALYEGCLA